jgi:uncharacterized protein YaaW (UPF0174 family)
MNTDNIGFSRRTLLILSALVSSIGIFGWIATKPKAIAEAAPFVKPMDKWNANHFYNFLKAIPTDTMLALKKSLGILDPKANATKLKGSDQDAGEIQKHALWLSSNILAYPFRDKSKLNYHELVTWVSSQAGVPQNAIQKLPTFALERELHKFLFIQLWDKLNTKQRKDLLAKLDPNGAIKDKAAIIALGGASALAALSATVAFTGFAFYTTMSITIATVASTVGITLPFASYAAASSVVGVLSGPIGWALMGAVALGGVALAGRPNLQKTATLIAQIHALKIEALVAAGVPEQEVFSVIVNETVS